MIETFGVFLEDKQVPLCKGFFEDLDEAKLYCQEIVQSTGIECFLFSFHTLTEVARYRKNTTHAHIPFRQPLTGTTDQERA